MRRNYRHGRTPVGQARGCDRKMARLAVSITVFVVAMLMLAIELIHTTDAEAQEPGLNFTRLFEEEFGGIVADVNISDGSQIIERPVYVRHQSDSMVVLEEGYFPQNPKLFWDAVDTVRSYGYEIHDFSRTIQQSNPSFRSGTIYFGESLVILTR